MASDPGLTVAVTGPTGTFGFGLMPILEADQRIERVVGVARRPFEPAEHGWMKMTYRQGDIRDAEVLKTAFEGADVVVHLAFLVTGSRAGGTGRAINVDGTLNAFRAAAAAGAARFVYASSVSAYGFHPDNPVGMTEQWPTRPAVHLPYAQEKAELEAALAEAAAELPGLGLYLLRAPVVIGPHVVGGKSELAERLLPLGRRALYVASRLPLRIPVPAPELPLQVIHEDDVGSAFLQCVVGAGPPGAYNIAADGILTGVDIVRELGLRPVPIPSSFFRRVAARVAGLPTPGFVPAVAPWAEAVSHPVIVDTAKAKRELHWTPRHSALEAVRSTLTA